MSYVGKVLRWSRPGGPFATRIIIVDYVILWEQGDRMLTYNTKQDCLQWMEHVEYYLKRDYSAGHTMTVEEP